jgi:hypothetical protein
MRIRKAMRMAVFVPVAVGAVLVLSVAPASAAYTLTGTFGSATSTPTDPEPLSKPGATAIDQANGDVYVVDAGNQRVQKFNAAGEPLAFSSLGSNLLTGSATPAGSFAFSQEDTDYTGIAVDNSTSPSDPSAGDLYVVDYGHGVIDKFTPAGSYVSQLQFNPTFYLLGVAVDPAGNLWVDLTNGKDGDVYMFEFSDGEPNTEIRHWSSRNPAVNSPYPTLAVDANGNLYAGSFRFTSEGAFEGDVAGETATSVAVLAPVAVDPVTNYVYGRRGVGVSVYDASPMDSGAQEGLLLATFGEEVIGHQARGGVAVNGLAGKVYVADDENSNVDVFSFPVLPGVVAKAPSGVGATSITLNATVNPVARKAHTIEFEYGTSSAYGATVAASPGELAPGTSAVPVSVSLAGLTPNTLYHYRILATNEEGTSSTADLTFHTPPAPTTVNDQPAFASEVGQFEATLNGTINPGNGVVSYRFLYGPTSAYGSSVPVPEGFAPVNLGDDAVSERIGGLRAGTTYHFALVATGIDGTVVGPDETFTTLPVPAPTAATGGASEVGVGSATLSGAIDPHGWDTTYLFEYGTTTAYGASWPTIQVDMGALEGPQPVVVTVPNLQPKTTYHYRLLASNGGGTSYGQDMTFTTGEYPAQMIQEPPALTFGKVAASSAKKKHRTAGKHRRGGARHRSRHGRASGKRRRAR